MAEPRPIDVEAAARSEPRGSLSIRTLAMPADTNTRKNQTGRFLVTEGKFTYVALDEERPPRQIGKFSNR